ncbi:5-formyltetrahydrofolate cyclo-ligase [Salisediminibacterium selenitireducens]|uniref:5-formyltetrahydrofolate cyclo-ligase n=1 Tax=Bacillus selenitireducens (strain ATCC 700615 / DSM 15326 / MLS10) TaxID=439292 RepID=D6XW62_BACIE|nr:5-formyltetrahydrofolate cyclo-ligase [Salisediminibacterium selenitireducens]ADH99816.1 5-formyltetrahydrofolate cyclo-ligase [[Bacillus] selenitireducens MLS10]
MSKKALREKVMTELKAMSSQEKSVQEQKLYQKLSASVLWNEAQRIAVTRSMMHEVDTGPVIDQALREGKEICLPVCDVKDRSMAFYLYEDDEKLIRSSFGVLEPDPNASALVSPERIDLILVPGIVFAKDGYRIGHGAGYYDRFLSRYPRIPTVSLVLREQLRQTVPHESHDVAVQMLIHP